MKRHDRDILISRAADGDATDADWSALERIAAQHPALWRELCHAQRHAAALRAAVADAVADAERTDLPTPRPRAPITARITAHITAWSGWAVAATLALLVGISTLDATRTPPRAQPDDHALQPVGHYVETPEEALQWYIHKGRETGRVIAEVPTPVLLDAFPLEDGSGYETLYVRQLIERAVLPPLYRPAVDESGRVTPVRIAPAPTHAAGL